MIVVFVWFEFGDDGLTATMEYICVCMRSW